MNDLLNDCFTYNIIIKTQLDTTTTPHRSLVYQYSEMVKDMFLDVVPHKYCTKVARLMIKVLKDKSDICLEEACFIGAKLINEKENKHIFPLDKVSFEKMLKMTEREIDREIGEVFLGEKG